MNKIVAIRGGGDIASGVAHRLKKSGFNVVILEIPKPTVIRRTVSYASAVFEGSIEVEGITAKLVGSIDELYKTILQNQIPVIIDPECIYINKIKPSILVDCILAKKNIGTKESMAPIVIAVGPGFKAGVDVHAVIESVRGHNLGRTIYSGEAQENTGEPGNVGGYSHQRIIRAVDIGKVVNKKSISELVEAGETICTINDKPVFASINGIIRGLIYDGSIVYKYMKIGDIDPRANYHNCFTISDKARAIGGGVLEAILYLENKAKGKSM